MSFTRRGKRLRSARKRWMPKKYQENCVRFGITRPAAGFFLSPGLGKTSILLFIFKILYKLGLVDTLLVLATRNIIYEVWPRELKKWKGLKRFRCSIVHGDREAALAKEDCSVFLMNYEGLHWMVEYVSRRYKLTKQAREFFKGRKVMLAVDESSKIRNTDTLRFKSLKQILPQCDRRYIMTGSPTPKSMLNLFGQLYALDLGKALGRFITHYRNEYFMPTGYGGYDWKLQHGGEKRIFKRIKHLVIRYGTDQLDLPPIKFIDRWVTLPKAARKLYDELEREMIVKWRNHEIVAANAAVVSGKLRQVANGGIFVDEFGNYLDDELDEKKKRKAKKWLQVHNAKNEALVELLDELNGEPALIGYEYKHDRERLKRYYQRNDAKHYLEGPFIDGRSKRQDVRAAVKAWEHGDLINMHGNTCSVAHGLNLQGKGGIVIYYALTWDLENYEQFFQRVWRQGQKLRVLVYRLLARDTVDELMIESLRIKDTGQRRLLKAMERRYG